MIVALTGTDATAAADLAQQLALLRTAAGGRVLFVSSPQAPRVRRRKPYDDIVINTSHDEDGASSLALAMAGVIVVLVRPDDLEAGGQDALLARVRDAIEVNPGARVLVSVANETRHLSPQAVGGILMFVAQIASARLADMLILDDSGLYHTRHSVLTPEDESDDTMGAPEVRHLYRQVFQGAHCD
jgi:hypothetical protein